MKADRSVSPIRRASRNGRSLPTVRSNPRAYPERRFVTRFSPEFGQDLLSVRQVWVSKFATQGAIYRINGEPRDDGWFTPEGETQALRIGRDCFLSREEAALDADSRRKVKVMSLRNIVERIETLIASD
ncbi:hypothetical protein C7453_11559 [Gluconacetobacter liquefaciens]|uniref:Uncharacterized protein n=1 Tax=Gluconacetobacter liquefaciens TaxID=89584 RepID=A0A370FUZ8_GLULI|nr:hypothetical protein C7453_11559 [Gluconacetobacter liquefaciens]